MREDTIFAPASAVGGAVAVIRISGPDAARVARLLSADVTKTPRELRFVRVRDGAETVDDGMAVYLPAPRTYTGEPMAEIHCHGGSCTVQRVLALLSGCGFRPAEAGEFTRRAFVNGKMDLSQAEAVMDVVNAAAQQSLRAAVAQLNGSVSRAVGEVESLLLDALSGIDAALDYPDEAETDAYAALPEQLKAAQERIARLLAEGRRGRVLRDGLRVVLLGRPNVGKSSLLNALLGSERAIVTGQAGTTRDVLDERAVFDGVPVRLFDTAGIREAQDEAERIGVSRAREALARADVLLVVLDGAAPLAAEDAALLAETAGRPRILVRNKCDLPAADMELPEAALPVSARTGAGLDALRTAILALAAPQQDAGDPCVTNERHLRALDCALASIRAAQAAAELDCAATDLRAALRHLGTITGTDVDERVIDRIFANFCVGK